MPLQYIADLIVHTKTATSLGPVFTESLEQRTENPRVENSVITPVNMHPEDSDLIGAFLCLKVFGARDYSCLLSNTLFRISLNNSITIFPFKNTAKS